MSLAAVEAAHTAAGAELGTAGARHEQPSVFDAVAQESLMAGLHPALKHLVQFASAVKPERFAPVARRYDEIYLALDLLLQDYFLRHYNATFAENFYGIKRVGANSSSGRLSGKERLWSLALVSGLPYARRKLDALYERLKDEHEAAGNGASQEGDRLSSLRRHFVTVYPWCGAALEAATLCMQLSYALSKSSVHSPLLLLAGVTLANLTAGDYERFGRRKELPRPEGGGLVPTVVYLLRAFPNALRSAATRSVGVALFFVQFVDWWHASGHGDKFTSAVYGAGSVPPPPHAMVLREDAVLQLNPRQCPLCRKARRNDTVLAVSGYVFCYACIQRYLQSHHCCPVTRLPADKRHLVRLFAAAAVTL